MSKLALIYVFSPTAWAVSLSALILDMLQKWNFIRVLFLSELQQLRSEQLLKII